MVLQTSDSTHTKEIALLEALRRRIEAVREESKAAAADVKTLKRHAGLLASRGGIDIFRLKHGEEPVFEPAEPGDVTGLRNALSSLPGGASTFQVDVRQEGAAWTAPSGRRRPTSHVVRGGTGAAPKTLRINGTVTSQTDTGAPNTVIGIRYEITDKLAKIGTLGERAKRLRELLDNATALFYRFDLKHGGFRYSSCSAQQFPAFRERPESGDPIEMLTCDIHPDDVGRISELIRSALNTPARAKSSITLEYRRRNYQGVFRWLHEKLTFLPNQFGNISSIISSAQDMTPLKEALNALRESERRYRMMFELSPDMIWILDTQLKFMLVNPASEKLLGYSSMEFLRISPREYETAESQKKIREALREYLLRAMASPRFSSSQRYEMKLRRRDGRFIWAELAFAAYRDDTGRVLGICGSTRDITERKTLEEEMRRMQRELERRIADRSEKLSYINAQLNNEMERRKQMEFFMLHNPERDRALIGRELNEGLCQELVGMMCLCEVVRENLQGRDAVANEDITSILELLADAVRQAGAMAKGLNPLLADPRSLDCSLGLLAEKTSELFNVRCAFSSSNVVDIDNPDQALNLYRIAQEAVHNAVRHGKARNIEITLSGDDGNLRLIVSDDGCGRANKPENPKGMGLKIMVYRTQAMSGILQIIDRPEGGMTVDCSVPKM